MHDGVADLDARYAFQTDDGAIIEIVNQGYRHGPPEVIKKLAAGEPVRPGFLLHAHDHAARDRPSEILLGQPHGVRRHRRAQREAGVQIDLYSVE